MNRSCQPLQREGRVEAGGEWALLVLQEEKKDLNILLLHLNLAPHCPLPQAAGTRPKRHIDTSQTDREEKRVTTGIAWLSIPDTLHTSPLILTTTLQGAGGRNFFP